jgi:pantothenate kinase
MGMGSGSQPVVDPMVGRVPPPGRVEEEVTAVAYGARTVVRPQGDRSGAWPPDQEILRLERPEDVQELRALVDRYRAESAGERVIIGIVGEPGVGKSTLAEELVEDLGDDGVLVPLDGFHLSNRILETLVARGRKGAPDTFDACGFVQLVHRLRRQTEEVVYAPEYRGDVDEPVAGAIEIPRSTPVVVLEGSYLLLDQHPWTEVRRCLDAAWYVVVDDEVRLARLAGRHQALGLYPAAGRRWAQCQAEDNARLVRRTRDRAHLLIVTS